MNFFLKRGAIEGKLPPSFKDALSAYFRFAFWSKPKLGFTCSPQIIHSRENVSHVLKVSKEVYLIRKIHEPKIEELAPGISPHVQRVEFEVQMSDGNFKEAFAYVAKDVAHSIQEHLTSQSRGVLINGLIYALEGKFEGPNGYGLNLLSVVADFLLSREDLLKTIVGLSAAEGFLHSRTCGTIGSLEELRSAVYRRMTAYAQRMPGGSQVSTNISSLDQIFDQLFPIVIHDDKSAFFVHPIILSALLKLRLEHVVTDHDSTTLIDFVRLLEILRTGGKINYFGEEIAHFRKLGVTMSELLPVLISSLDTIRLSGLLYEYF